MEKLIEKAKVLIEALPYIKKFHGKKVVIKYGGSAMEHEEIKKAIMQDIVFMKYVGMNPIIIHGGGNAITEALKKTGKKSQFVDGLRVTDKETIRVVEQVLVEGVNKEIVSLINELGGNALGINGKSESLIMATKLEGNMDLGFVGQIIKIQPEKLNELCNHGIIPVIAPLGLGENGETYNINADTAASEIAATLRAEKLVLLTDVPGILKDKSDVESIMSTLKVSEIKVLKKRGVITGGMIPKIHACEKALNAGVKKSHIIDGRILHSLLLEIFTDKGIGTELIKN
ncbi:MAG: acetylglutamate kinase [bacterium]|nr:acetylglutamate kinase [bacterium]